MASFPTVDFSQYQWVVNDTNYLTKWNNFQTAINTLQANINKFGAEAKAEADSAIGIAQSLIEAYNVNVLEPFKAKCTLGLDFAQGVYFVDDGTERVETTDPESILTVDRNTAKREASPRGSLNEASIDTISRRWLDGVPLGLSQEEVRTNLALHSDDFNTSWAGGLAWTDSGILSPVPNVNYQRYAAPSDGAGNAITQDIDGGGGRITISVFIGRHTTASNILFSLADLTGGNSSRASVDILSGDIAGGNGNGSPAPYVEPCVNGKRVGVTFDSYDVASQRVTIAFKNSSGTSFVSDLILGDIVDATGSQIESGESFSSYIPTATVPVSRSADSVEFPINSSGRDEVTVYLEFYRNYSTNDGFAQSILEISSASKILSIDCSTENSRIRSDSLPYDTLNFIPDVYTDKFNKVALSIKPGLTILSVNGQSRQSSDDNSGLISVISEAIVLSPKRTSSVKGNDYRPRIYLKYKATTVAELNALTTGGQS